MSKESKFSANFESGNAKIKQLQDQYENSTNEFDKERLELIAFLQTNMSYLKKRYSNYPNSGKRDELFYFLKNNYKSIPDKLCKDRTIDKFLNKNGFFSTTNYAILSTVLDMIISSIALSIVCMFTETLLTTSFVILWYIISVCISYFLDIYEHLNFYMVTKNE